MKKILLIGIMIVMSHSAVATEEPKKWFFFGLGGSFMQANFGADLDTDFGRSSIEPFNYYLRGGISISRYIELGAEINNTRSSDHVEGSDFDLDTKFVYLKGNIPIGEKTNLYLMGGVTEVEVSIDLDQSRFGQSTLVADDNDIGYGIGLEYAIEGRSAISVDYISYYSADDTDFESWNFGFIGYF